MTKCRGITGYAKKCPQNASPFNPTSRVAISGFCGHHMNMAFTCGEIVQEIVTMLRNLNNEGPVDPVTLARLIENRYKLTQPDPEDTEDP